MRRLRYIPEGGALVEVTCRTIHSRFLLRPSAALNDIIVGVLGRAQRTYPIRICGYSFVSSHFHLLLDVDDALQLSRFMGYLSSNLAREIGRLVDWPDKVWARRYQAIVISGEAAIQAARLKYILAHGVKEGLVEKVTEWPGVHCARALLKGDPVEGTWFDRTQEYAARRRGEDFDRMRYATTEVLTISPLPCWKDFPEETQRRLAADLVAEIESEAAAHRQRSGKPVLGVPAILGQPPHTRPKHSKKSPAPLFHVLSKAVREELYAGYAWFVAAYREAATKLRDGNRTVSFPVGSFPPPLQFVAG
ncbi:MAG TPA: transposase [Thermoanaerobaculia bacterium]|nr:transposase [Thermoanaerobaculia bacterium]